MNDHVAEHLKLNIQWLKAIGFWPATSRNRLIFIAYSILSKFILVICILQTLCELAELIFVANKSLDEVSFLLGIILFHFITMVKLKVISGSRVKELTGKVLEIEREILNPGNLNQEVKKIYYKYVRQNRILNFISFIFYAVCVILYCITPIVTEAMDPPESLSRTENNGSLIVYMPRPLPLTSWFPFDRYKYYKTAYSWHVVNIMLVPFLFAVCDSYFYGLLIFCIGQLKILQHDLYRNCANRRYLRKFIENHKNIIGFIEELGKAMSHFMLVDFGVCGLQVAVLGLQIALEDVSVQVLAALTFFLAILAQLFLFYWFGNEILIESESIATTIWDSEWYLRDPSTKKMYLMIMLRSQKSLTLSVGPFYKVSTSTLMVIIKTSYSYGALMHRLYSDK